MDQQIKEQIKQLQDQLARMQITKEYHYKLDDQCTIEQFIEIFKHVGTSFILNEDQYMNLSSNTKKLFKLR